MIIDIFIINHYIGDYIITFQFVNSFLLNLVYIIKWPIE